MRPEWRGAPIVSIVTPPAASPVALAEAKAALRIAHTEEDSLIEGLIDVARAHLEGWDGALRRALISQVWRLAVCGPDRCGRVFAPLAPCSDIVSIKYFAPLAAELTTLDKTSFRLIASPDWAYVEPLAGVSWPSFDVRPDALQIDFACGYGNAESAIPSPIRQAIKLLVGHFYENREETTSLKLDRLPIGVGALVSAYTTGFYG